MMLNDTKHKQSTYLFRYRYVLPRQFNILFVFFFFLSAYQLRAQTSSYDCPPNIGFEYGDFTNWQTNLGAVADVNGVNVISLPPTTWVSNYGTGGRQTLMNRNFTTPATDLYGGFPVNPPNGGNYALKLGSDADDGICNNNNPCPGAKAEAARYIIHVPNVATNASITFSYAVVLENPLDAVNKHKDEEQPRFVVKMYDPVTNEVIPCADFGFMASGPLPGFDTAGIRKHQDAVIKYKPWSSVFVNLSKYAGRTLYLEFTTADCTKGGHFGYAYVDVIECGVAAQSLYRCSAPNTTTLVGPPGFESYKWYDEKFTTLIGTTQNVTLNPSPPLGTKYQVIATPYSNTGCPTCDCRDTVEVAVHVTYPTVSIGDDKTVCPGKPVTIGTDAVQGYSYQWSPTNNLSNPQGATTTATVTAPTNYTLTITDTLGCSAKDTIALSLYPPITVKATGSSICGNDSTVLHASGAASYLWSPANTLSNPTIANPIAKPSSTTIYTVVGTDSLNCYSDTAQATVTVKPTPTISLGPDVTLQTGDFYTLNSTTSGGNITKWLWTPSTNLSCTTCPEPTAEIKWDITYRVNVTNNYGCTASDTINIKTLCDNSSVYIPNAFTPDGDGVNDVFMVQGKNIYIVKSFRIFNRWGEMVFEKLNFSPNNPAFGWDGKVRGVVSPPDVFVYTVEVMCGSGKVNFFKGNVSLLK